MASLATRRLIEASSTLAPADRALLNLWVNRGIGDERLTGLTGLSAEALEGRRRRIVAALATELGLPETDVRGAIIEITPAQEAPSGSNGHGARTRVDPETEPAAVAEPQPAAVAEPEPVAVAEPEPVAQPEPAVEPESAAVAEVAPAQAPATPTPRRRGALWLSLAAITVAVILIVIIASSGSSTPHRTAQRAPAPTTASTPSPTTASTAASPTTPAPDPLSGLPGGLAHTTGSIKLTGRGARLKLKLTVTGLPAPHNGHYEVWLYNSVLNSQPLARLRENRHNLTIALPRAARRYRWLDVSFQPLGTVYHSGESVLRAANPAHDVKARKRTRSPRRHRKLRPAGTVSTTHGTRRPAGPTGSSQRRRRIANGSKNAITS